MRGRISHISEIYTKLNNKHFKSYEPKQELKYIIHLDTNIFSGYAMPNFYSTSGFNWIDPREFHSNKYSNDSSKGCVSEVDLEYPNELRKLHNDYFQVQGKIETKKEMMSQYQLLIGDLYNISIGNVENWVLNFFGKGKYVLHYENLQLYLRLGSKLKYLLCIRIQ